MKKLNAGWRGWLAASALAALVAACGTAPGTSELTGSAQADGPVVGRVTVVDASANPVRREAATRADGTFTVDTAGMTPPFLVRVEGMVRSNQVRIFSASGDGRGVDVNPITSAAFSGAAGSSRRGEGSGGGDDDAFEHQGGGEHHDTARRYVRLLQQLETALAPLFERYGITDPATDRAAVRLLLADVRFAVSGGVVTVTNRATGAVIFTGPLSDLASGTFDPTAMPPGPGTGGGGGGGGGGGADGAALYDLNCSACHGPLATSQVRGESLSDIREAIAENEGGMGSLAGLSVGDLTAIAGALSGSGGGSNACTYTYSAWGACTSGTQSRTVLSAMPAGCTGTPVLTQACGGAIDGAALYTQYCAGCHGNSKKGRPASAISAAIANNTGGMGSAALRALTAEQIAAIAAAP